LYSKLDYTHFQNGLFMIFPISLAWMFIYY